MVYIIYNSLYYGHQTKLLSKLFLVYNMKKKKNNVEQQPSGFSIIMLITIYNYIKRLYRALVNIYRPYIPFLRLFITST